MILEHLMESIDSFSRKRGILIIAGSLSVLLIFLQGWFTPFYQDKVYDSYSYYFAAEAINQNLNPYNQELLRKMGENAGIEDVYPYLYPPLLAAVWRPITVMSPQQAHKALVIVNAILFSINLVFIFKIVNPPRHPYALFLIFALFQPLNGAVAMTMRLGQINGFVMLPTLLCLYFHLKGRESLSALALSIAIMLKLTPAILLFYFILYYKRRWQFLTKLILWSILIVAGSFALTSPSSWRDFLYSSMQGPPFRNIDSFWGILDISSKFIPLLAEIKIWLYLIIAIPLLALALLSIRHCRMESRPLYAFSILILLSLFLSPLTWPHHYYLALLPYYYFPICYWGEKHYTRFMIYICLIFIALINIPKPVLLPLGRFFLLFIIALRNTANFVVFLISLYTVYHGNRTRMSI